MYKAPNELILQFLSSVTFSSRLSREVGRIRTTSTLVSDVRRTDYVSECCLLLSGLLSLIYDLTTI